MNLKNSKPKKWTSEITKSLVELYELQPILYNTTVPTYHNRMMRQKALEIIKLELETMYKVSYSPDVIQKKLHNLRTQFLEVHRNFNKIVTTDPGAEDIQPSWWLYDQLKFLLPFCKKDKGESNLSATTNHVQTWETHCEMTLDEYENTSDNEKEEKVFTDTNTERFYEADEDNILSPGVCTSPDSPASVNKTIQVGEEMFRIRVKRKRNNESITNILADAVKKAANEKSDISPEIESFCRYVGHELAHFKKESSLQKCKWEILQIVHKMLEREKDEN